MHESDMPHGYMTHTPIASEDSEAAPDDHAESRDERDSATGVADVEKKSSPAGARVDELPPYRVLLHNDDLNDMVDVVNTIVELTPHGREKAVEVMLRAHTSGRALLLVTHRERAELYVEQFRSRRLTVTMERAG